MKYFIICLLAIFLISPVFAQSKKEKQKEKEQTAAKEYEKTKTLIESGVYTIEALWATSQKGRRINLTTNYSFLKFNQKEADIDLPFFGQAYSGSVGFGGDSGVKFKGTVANYSVEFNDKKQRVDIKFNGKGKNDTYNFNLSIFKSGNVSINVTSNNRSAMKYDGKVIESKKIK